MDKSVLIQAINERNVEKIKHLLESGQCLLKEDCNVENPPLLECVIPDPHSGGIPNEEDAVRCEILKILVRHGAEINVQVNGISASMLAANYGYLNCLRFLVESGADFTVESHNGRTALTMAVMNEEVECVKYLAKHLPLSTLNYKDKHGMSALMLAAYCESEMRLLCMQHLISAGVDLDLEGQFGFTASKFALYSCNNPAVKLLRQSGAAVSTVENNERFSPLTWAAMWPDFSMMSKLLQCAAENPTFTQRDQGCLHRAFNIMRKPKIRALVMQGFPPLECLWSSYEFRFSSNCISVYDLKLSPYLRKVAVSPLALALLGNCPGIARYFITNHYFTRFDIVHLCWDPEIRQFLLDARFSECLEILAFLSQRPHSLFTLSLVAVSSALSRDMRGNIEDVKCDKESSNDKDAYDAYDDKHENSDLDVGSSRGNQDEENPSGDLRNINHCVFRPRETVESLGLPSTLQQTLLYQTPTSGICCYLWEEIPLGGQVNFPECNCQYCVEGEEQ